MPAPVSAPDFLALVRRSDLVDPTRLTTFLGPLEAAGRVPEKPRDLARLLLNEGLLTRFQADLLLKGKCRGLVLGNYRILERIGSGGNGTVYLAEHRRMGRKVALKVLPSDRTDDPAYIGRFRREAQAAAALDHPNIVHAYDVEVDGRIPFLVMEYVDGPNLQEVLARGGRLDINLAVGYAWQAAAGLDHAHRAGLVHRDIKPANLLVTRTGVVKILDMGLARFFKDETDVLTRQYAGGAVLGTADYVAPEQARDSHGVDIRADLYSLGATLYYLLAGQPPFAGGTLNQKLMWHQLKTPAPLTDLRPEVPRGLAAVVSKMLAKDPAERYQTPEELISALAPWTPPAPSTHLPAGAGSETTGTNLPGPTALDFSLPATPPRGGSSTVTGPPPTEAASASSCVPQLPGEVVRQETGPETPVDTASGPPRNLDWADIAVPESRGVGRPSPRTGRLQTWHLVVGTVGSLALLGSVLAWALVTRPVTVPSPSPSTHPLLPLRASVRPTGEIDLRWEALPGDESPLQIERALELESAGGWNLLATVAPGVGRYTDATATPGSPYYYRLTLPGPGGARAVSHAAWPPPNYDAGFQPHGLVTNGGAGLVDSSLRLTDGGPGQTRSAFYHQPLNIRSFTTSFRFLLQNAAAEGFTFCLQGDGPGAVGAGGGGLGYEGLTRSVAVKFDLFDNAGEGTNSTGVLVGGRAPQRVGSVNLTGYGIDLHAGRPCDVTVSYNNRILTLSITDPSDRARGFRKTFVVDVPAAVGGSRAYAGFTASTGATGAIQDIRSWTWSPGSAP